MALAKEMNWYVRAGGAETNGGGYDGTNYPGGVNYADQDSPQLSLTDLTSTNSTTVTSVLSTFTANMVGNVLRIASGTGATTGYYVIVAYVSASQVTLDRVSGTYTAGVAKVGGAHHNILVYSSSGTGTAPILTTPLIAGNVINVRGGGTDDPALASFDYDNSSGYWILPNGDTTSGRVKIIGYNGRPCFKTTGLVIFATAFLHIENIKYFPKTSPTYTTHGFANGSAASSYSVTLNDIIADQNGSDGALHTQQGGLISNFEFRNTGGGAAGAQAALVMGTYNGMARNGWIHGVRGVGVNIAYGTLEACIISDCGSSGIVCSTGGGGYVGFSIINCTIDGNGGDGINFTNVSSLEAVCRIVNNIISNHAVAGKYGFTIGAGSAVANALFFGVSVIDYNNYYGNTADYNKISAGAHDTAIDPQYVAAGSDNYAVGTNMKAIGSPGIVGKSPTTQYLDLGAAQRQEAGGGGGLLVHPGMAGGMRG